MVFYISAPDLVILAQAGDKLMRGQARAWCTDRRTHKQTQAMTIAESQNWPQVRTTQRQRDENRLPEPLKTQFTESCITSSQGLF